MSRNMVRDIERSGNRISRNAHIAWRAEQVIARRRLALLRTQTGLMAFAGLVAGIGVLMVNVGLFFWLAGNFGNAGAGGILAAVNLGLAAVLGGAAARMSVEQELAPAIEVRDLAMEDIEAELSDGLTEVKHIADDMRRIATDPLGAVGSGLLGPVLSILVNSLKK